MNNLRNLVTLTLSGSVFLFLSCQPEKPQEEAEKKPVPKYPWDWVPDEQNLAKGREIYDFECSGCHNEGEEGAPSLAKADEWAERQTKGLETLFDHAINGFQGKDGKMPARGGTPSLSDEEVQLAVRYMLAAPK